MKDNKKNNFKKWSKKFFDSTRPLIIALMIIIAVLIWFCYHLMYNTKTYMFNGKSDYVSILNGVININDDVSLFEGSDISYLKEDLKVKKYTIGYYVKVDGKYKAISLETGSDDSGLSLKGLLMEKLSFNVTEPTRNKHYFTKETIKAIDNGVYFIIDATSIKDEVIKDEVKLDLVKISR